MNRTQRILTFAAGILSLSVLLMILTIPGFLNDISPRANPKAAIITTSTLILVRLLILMGYIKIIRDSKHFMNKRDGACLGIGIVLMFLALLKLNGAYSFLDHKDIFYVPVLMFTGVICELIASILTIIVFFLQPKRPTTGEATVHMEN